MLSSETFWIAFFVTMGPLSVLALFELISSVQRRRHQAELQKRLETLKASRIYEPNV